jgi:hypothetical protein
MQEARLKRAARALGEMPLSATHEIVEIAPFSLRDYLEEVLVDEASSDIDIDAVLERMVEVALTAYQNDDPSRD